MPLFNARNRYIAILALVAALILMVGWQFRPRVSAEVPLSQADISRLSRMTKKGELEASSAFFTDVMNRVRNTLLWVEGIEQPGVVWDRTGTIIAPAPPVFAGAGATLRDTGDAEISLVTELYSYMLSFRLLKAPPELALEPIRPATGNLSPGAWLVAARRSGGEGVEMSAGVFSASRALRCGQLDVTEHLSSFAFSSSSLGSAVFDLDARFVGMVLECDGTPRLVSSQSVTRAVERARAVDSQLLFRYGFRPMEMDERLRSYFGVDGGLLVREVWRESLAWDRGLRPGDVIVNLDGEAAGRLEDLAMMTVPMYRPEYPLAVRRGRQTRQVVLPPGLGLGGESENVAPPPVLFETPSTGVLVRAVLPGSAEADAGLRSGDVLVSVGPQFGTGRPTATTLRPDRDRPVFVVVERNGVLKGFLLDVQKPEPPPAPQASAEAQP